MATIEERVTDLEHRVTILEGGSPPPSGDPHAFFNSFASHPKLWREYSLRDQEQLNELVGGNNPFVKYDSSNEQDAAKVTIISGKVSLRPYPIIPIGISSGSSLSIWDHFWGNEYLGPLDPMENHKQFVHTCGGGNDRWTEIRARYRQSQNEPGSVCRVDLRSYGSLLSNHEMTFHGVQPMLSEFYAKPGKWTRYYHLSENLAGNPTVTIWIADEDREPTLLLRSVIIVSPEWEDLRALRMQFNSSQNRVNGPDLISYLRNVLIFKDLSYEEIVGGNFLQRP